VQEKLFGDSSRKSCADRKAFSLQSFGTLNKSERPENAPLFYQAGSSVGRAR
jgi:hypothetical protein